jgi:hypothetical protein
MHLILFQDNSLLYLLISCFQKTIALNPVKVVLDTIIRMKVDLLFNIIGLFA